MASLVNNAVFNATSAGTVAFVVASAVTGYQTPAAVGVIDGKSYRYRAQNLNLTEWEEGTAVSSSSGTGFTRVVTASSAGGTTTCNFTLAPIVMLTMFAADVLQFDDAMSLSSGQKVQAQSNLGLREVLTGPRTYFVRSDGNDSNSGLVNSAGGAFLTAQAAVNRCYTIDLNNNNVTIQMVNNASTPQTYTGTVTAIFPFLNGGVTLQGDVTTPSNLVISTGASGAITADGFGSAIDVIGIKLLTTSGAGAINATNGGRVRLVGKIEFGACGTHMISNYAGRIIVFSGTYTVTGGAIYHMRVSNDGFIGNDNNTATITGTPAFTGAFISCSSGGIVETNNTWSGAATGTRYLVDTAGGLATFGATLNTYVPGSVNGTVTAPGWSS